MARRKSNWEKLSSRKPEQTTAYRDVYESQQLDRSSIGHKIGMKARIVFSILFGLLAGIAIYILISAISGAMGSLISAGDTQTESVPQETLSSVEEAVTAALPPLSDAPEDITLDDLKAGYLYYVAPDASTADMTGYYLDSEGNRYLENELSGLLNRIAAGELKDAQSQREAQIKAVKEANGGILPISMAPMNIELSDFIRLYFRDLNPDSFVHTYEDSQGNQYSTGDIGTLLTMVQSGELGSGQISTTTADGGSPEADSLPERAAKSWLAPSFRRVFFSIFVAIVSGLVMLLYLRKNLDAQNASEDTLDINQYDNDQHIQLPEEVQRNYDWFPDVGAHSRVQPNSMLSHMALSNKGLNRVKVTRRAAENIKDADGDVLYLKGEPLLDDNDEPIMDLLPAIDEPFMEELFTVSELPKDKKLRKHYDPSKIPYNPGNKYRGKLKNYETVADLINGDWELPAYETQRPAGAYIVDTEPVNTMILAITRAGKGQTYIESMIDMWTREINYNNIVVNDPKGELLVKFYVRATVRGFQVVQFNLINVMNTDIYNALALASDSAREGDFTKCAQYVENIAEVFFPVDGAEDPVWPNAANNAFKRAAYGLIDYFLEEEKALRRWAARVNLAQKTLDSMIDQLWGKVTLYNCYQLFVQMTSKKKKNPKKEFRERSDNHEFEADGPEPLTEEEYQLRSDRAAKESELLWEEKPEADMLTTFFNAYNCLPKNQMRTLVRNADDALRSMGGAEKMMSSVYGIAITAMSFFADPTISTLTSGTPSQNVDLGGLSFPRRFGVRFHPDYVTKHHLVGLQSKWMSFTDATFETPLGKDFAHDEIISREGWARYYFKGIYPENTAYIRMQIVNPKTDVPIKTFYFKFTKGYQMSLDARYYVKDPILDEKIVKNGVLVELTPVKKNGTTVYEEGHTTFMQEKIADVFDPNAKKAKMQTRAITQYLVKYAEKPKIVFLVTPPHLMKYAKLILILIKQLVDLNFDRSYLTKSNQKPLYRTRYMLDELGNLQSEGHGIAGFQTYLSIGLGQDQQFTLILQTLQQLRDVYGESADKIIQGNVSNIIFLKSTDDSMLETLSKMSGTTHKVYRDSKTITRDMERVAMQNEGKVSYTLTSKEQPVISYNDMAFIAPRNSIVFRAGDSPIWNRNETILPMSWKIEAGTIRQPGKEYSLQTIPTLSTAMDFDVRKNQPDFMAMWQRRHDQALIASDVMRQYQVAYGYDDYQMSQLDPEVYSDEIMELIDKQLHTDDRFSGQVAAEDEAVDMQELYDGGFLDDGWEENEEQAYYNRKAEDDYGSRSRKVYAEGFISKDELVGNSGYVTGSLDRVFLEAFDKTKGLFVKDIRYFQVDASGNVYRADGNALLIKHIKMSQALEELNAAAKDPSSRVFAEGDLTSDDVQEYELTPEFYRFLAGFDTDWPFAEGAFAREVARIFKEDEE